MKAVALVLATMTMACAPNNPTVRPVDGRYFCCENTGFYDTYSHGTGCTPVDEKDFATCGAGIYCAGNYAKSDTGLYCPAS